MPDERHRIGVVENPTNDVRYPSGQGCLPEVDSTSQRVLKLLRRIYLLDHFIAADSGEPATDFPCGDS